MGKVIAPGLAKAGEFMFLNEALKSYLIVKTADEPISKKHLRVSYAKDDISLYLADMRTGQYDLVAESASGKRKAFTVTCNSDLQVNNTVEHDSIESLSIESREMFELARRQHLNLSSSRPAP